MGWSKLLSKYKVDSEVSRLNRLGKITASSDTFYIIKRAKEFTQKTNGAFDITVAPLMDLWGFTERNFSVPSEIKIKQSLQLVGSDKIILHENSNVIEFKLSGMKIDLGGIAKGYALDCAVEKLKANHINSCLINAGGQVFAMGRKFGSAWKIALRPPRSNQIKEYLRLSDKSVSTSGDYEQYFIKGNKRYAHILDPKTGSPADAKILSVSVIADNALTADALSTAIFVLGRDKSKDIIKAFPGLETRIYENDQ